MSSWRKCFLGCQHDACLFTFPNDKTTRQMWSDFIFENHPPPKKKNVFVCAQHFAKDCFVNKDLFEGGQIKKLVLKPGAIPTIKPAATEPKPTTTESTSSLSAELDPIWSRKQTSFPKRKSVATQLSAGTLKLHHCRSKGVQATVPPTTTATETQQPWLQLLSTPVTATTSGISRRPTKRPRVESEEEEEEDLEIFAPLSHDFTYEPDDSVTDTSDAELTQMESASAYKDAKYIVFESCLRELFERCPVCNQHCEVQRQRCGTFVAFTQNCPLCLYSRKWQSQPVKGSTPVGNLQLSAAVYFTGGSFVQVAKVCKAMNVKVHQYDTFRKHARLYLEPAIYHKWKLDQDKLIEKMKRKGKIAVGGDMRADSPGHSAKFGSYTLMELENNKILDIQLVQSNEVGGSMYMEKEGLKQGLDFLESKSLEVDYIVTDRHTQVQKYLRDREVTQYYDVCHLVKGISKKLNALAKNKECEVVKKWLPAIKNHMYWTACSSKTGAEKVAKWKSLVNHIQNVHTHEDPLFPKCAHPDRASKDPKKWFQPGTKALYKVEKLLMSKRVLGDVQKLSSKHQTSALESFHSVILRFAPKNVVFSFNGLLCRLYLAAMHHNENVTREQALSKGKPLYKVMFAKPIKSEVTCAYVRDLMELVFTELFDDPTTFVEELRKVPVPEDLTAQFERPR